MCTPHMDKPSTSDHPLDLHATFDLWPEKAAMIYDDGIQEYNEITCVILKNNFLVLAGREQPAFWSAAPSALFSYTSAFGENSQPCIPTTSIQTSTASLPVSLWAPSWHTDLLNHGRETISQSSSHPTHVLFHTDDRVTHGWSEPRKCQPTGSSGFKKSSDCSFRCSSFAFVRAVGIFTWLSSSATLPEFQPPHLPPYHWIKYHRVSGLESLCSTLTDQRESLQTFETPGRMGRWEDGVK